jgi:hypothetical protein
MVARRAQRIDEMLWIRWGGRVGHRRIGGPRGYGLGGVGPAAVCPCRRAPGLVCFGVYALRAMVALPQVSMLPLDRSQSL